MRRISKARICLSQSSRRPIHATCALLYDYRPLQKNETRLLDLQPGRDEAPLRCHLRNVSFLDDPRYESLSYCWGLNKPEAKIESENGSIPVTKNLFTALRYLRDGEQARTLWIDAICINQDDVEERGEQVGLMKDIYRRSERTIVWLGEEQRTQRTVTGHDVIEFIRYLAQAAQRRGTHQFWQSHESSSLPPLYNPVWSAFAQVLQRPWFRRLWIVQEASVTRNIEILCGLETISWEELMRAVQYAVDLGVLIAYGGSDTYQALRLFETRSNFQSGHLPPLHQVLLSNRSFQASDARDKIFGLLSLADQADIMSMQIYPNYHLSVEQLYKNMTLALLRSPDLSALSGSGIHDPRKGGVLPSWVTDWSISDPSIPLDTGDSLENDDKSSYAPTHLVNFDASRGTISSIAFDEHKSSLSLEGLLFDQVETVGVLSQTRYLRRVSHMFELFVQCHDALEQLKNWEQVARVRTRGRYPTGEKIQDAYWHTLCAGRVPEGLKSATSDPRFKYYVMIRPLRHFVRIAIHLVPREETNTWYNRLFYSMFQTVWITLGLTPAKGQRIGFPPESRLSNYRRMVRTKKGYLALAPRFTQPGDWIGVYKGGKLPLVVRKAGAHLVLIGEGYVHGLMKGEAWDETGCEQMWFK
ncbi:HET-domain-containing protein [Byssothecium circinans]|uniref:HET-domain-containing protein n=1 Tax=Byssothecium circinans TaxID=147558 RepID=A0A6A5T8K6_9PLEO|nr:HET-domain-containing protein [Byssothecium circinans]